MPRRVWCSLVLLAAGAALMVVAQLAGAARERTGGVLKVGMVGASVQIDPQLSYVSTGWWLEYATGAKLYDYRPGGQLVPEVASRFTVSDHGKRYTFYLRRGFRFSDGALVTARNFEYAFDRATSSELQSPAAQFVTKVRGVHAHGMKLVVDLSSTKSELLPIVAMPFFQATSMKLPLDREVEQVSRMADLPTAGPYAFALNDVNRLTSVRRNPYWTRGPGRSAPRNLDGVDVQWNLDEQTAFEMVKAGQLDEGPIPAAEQQNLANQYGVNRSQFWVKPTDCIGLIALNNDRGVFHGNAPLRRALNWALDRTAYNGPWFTRSPWTHLLPPGAPGSVTKRGLQPYGPTANLEKARKLAAGHLKDGKVSVAFRSSGALNLAQAEVVRRALLNLGFDSGNITMTGFSGGGVYDALGKRGSVFDVGVSLGWCGEPYLFSGSSVPTFFPNVPQYRDKIAAALRLKGHARAEALGKLDLDIMRNLAPVAVTTVSNNIYFFSKRVDPRSLAYHRVYDDWSIPNLALK